jgi:nucleotide-binding universal stress UspA family protein
MGTIVVGVDESAGSDSALRWALQEARLRGAKLRVVHVYPPAPLPVSEAGVGAVGGMGVPVVAESAAELGRAAAAEATNLIEEALRRAGTDSLHVEIERVALEGAPAQTLIESARGMDLLVLGSRGRGGFLGLLLGSVSQQCAQHPPCPVVILPPPDEAE